MEVNSLLPGFLEEGKAVGSAHPPGSGGWVPIPWDPPPFWLLPNPNPCPEKCHLWDVKMMDLPHSRVRVTASQSKRRATGSMPVEGSSRKITGGPPIRAMPALSFRLLPPLRKAMGMGTETRHEHRKSSTR